MPLRQIGFSAGGRVSWSRVPVIGNRLGQYRVLDKLGSGGMDNFIEDFIDIANGTTHVVQNGVDFGTFTNIQYRNSNVPKRDYKGMVFQADYRLKPTWQIAGSYTLQFVNDGTFERWNV